MATEQENKSLLTVPNILSGYRLCAAPIIVLSLCTGAREVFVWLITLHLFTDILDGLIARIFRMQTEFGAKLDSYADIATYILAATGLIVFQNEFFMSHLAFFVALLGSYLAAQLVSLLKFGCATSMHLYSSKICGYVQAGFFLYLFWIGGSQYFLYVTVLVALLNNLEEILVISRLQKPIVDARSLFHIMKSQRVK